MGRQLKFIVVNENGSPKLRFGYVEFHKHLVTSNDVKNHYHCIGGGNWYIDKEKHTVTLYGSSSDYGTCDKHNLKAAVKNYKEEGDVQDLSLATNGISWLRDISNDDFIHYKFEIE